MRGQLFTDTSRRCTSCKQAKHINAEQMTIFYCDLRKKAAIFRNTGLTLPFNYRLGYKLEFFQNLSSS